jgi:Uma2 family endonuclease
MNNTAIKLTYREFLQINDDFNRHEIIEGEHYVTPSPSKRHQKISITLSTLLYRWVEDHALGEVFAGPYDVVLSQTDVVIPDLLFISKSRASISHEENVQGAPDLMVEILSPSTSKRDLGIKKTLYEKFGVLEYWVVDPDQKSIEIFRSISGKFAPPIPLFVKDQLTSPLFPNLTIPLSRIFNP